MFNKKAFEQKYKNILRAVKCTYVSYQGSLTYVLMNLFQLYSRVVRLSFHYKLVFHSFSFISIDNYLF